MEGCTCGYHSPDIGPGAAAEIARLMRTDRRKFELHLLTCAAEAANQANNRVDAQALEARAAGATWGAIGRALGITKQAAQKRYDRRLF